MPQHISRPQLAVCIDVVALDVFAPDPTTPMPQGRPHLTVCFDLATRTPIGHHVGFEPPSIHIALLALQGASRHDRPWNGWRCPAEILPDNGAAHRLPDLQQAVAACAPDSDARLESDR